MWDNQLQHHLQVRPHNYFKYFFNIIFYGLAPTILYIWVTQASFDITMGGPTAFVVGHSFVRRYASWIGHHHMAPKRARDICTSYSDIRFLGHSGLNSEQLHSGDILFQATKHDIVVIDCGTNDIANDVSQQQIANNILLFARRCLQDGVAVVYILSVLPRSRRISGSPEEFRRKVQAFNDHMKSLCVKENDITFCRQNGFMNIDCPNNHQVACWSDDGIHPSTRCRHQHNKSGMEKYHQSIKSALHRAFHRYRHINKVNQWFNIYIPIPIDWLLREF